MKRTKKTKPEFVMYSAHMVQWQCPHCKTHMQDYTISKRILKVLCSQCNNPVEFKW